MSEAQAATNQEQSAGTKQGGYATSMDIKNCHCNESLRIAVNGRELSQCAKNIIRARGLSLDS